MKSNKYIRVFSTVEKLFANVGARTYLWGGWVPDIYMGRILREHDDTDCLVVDLYGHIKDFESKFQSLGWETKIIENGDLVAKKDNMKIHCGHLKISGEKAIWYHNGRKGQIVFPRAWLNNESIGFQNIRLHAVTPEFQYALKNHPEYMNKEWKNRKKDLADLKVLKEILIKQCVSLEDIDRKIYVK